MEIRRTGVEEAADCIERHIRNGPLESLQALATPADFLKRMGPIRPTTPPLFRFDYAATALLAGQVDIAGSLLDDLRSEVDDDAKTPENPVFGALREIFSMPGRSVENLRGMMQTWEDQNIAACGLQKARRMSERL